MSTYELCRLCKGEVQPDGAHLHRDDQVTHNELLAHQEHLQEQDYRLRTCGFCIELLARARSNHSEHAGFPSLPQGAQSRLVRPGWWVLNHTDAECIAAYRRYAEMMSRS